VGAPSNMERIFDLFADPKELYEISGSMSVDDDTIRDVIKRGPADWGKIFCPHTATAVYFREQNPQGHAVLVATAHPAKFETVVEPLVGHEIGIPEELASLMHKESHYEEIDATLDALRGALGG